MIANFFSFLDSQLTLVVHCLSRTPSTKKPQLNNNYSALTLKFGALEPGQHMTTLNRGHYMIPTAQNSREINRFKDARHFDDVGNFGSRIDDLPPFMMNRSHHPYQSGIKIATSYDPTNFSCSQHTNSTTLSRENSLKCGALKKGRVKPSKNKKATVDRSNDNRKSSFTEKLRKVLIFKTDGNSSLADTEQKIKIKKKPSNGSLGSGNTISNSSLKEIDEEEFTSSELAQKMFEINNEIRNANFITSHTS